MKTTHITFVNITHASDNDGVFSSIGAGLYFINKIGGNDSLFTIDYIGGNFDNHVIAIDNNGDEDIIKYLDKLTTHMETRGVNPEKEYKLLLSVTDICLAHSTHDRIMEFVKLYDKSFTLYCDHHKDSLNDYNKLNSMYDECWINKEYCATRLVALELEKLLTAGEIDEDMVRSVRNFIDSSVIVNDRDMMLCKIPNSEYLHTLMLQLKFVNMHRNSKHAILSHNWFNTLIDPFKDELTATIEEKRNIIKDAITNKTSFHGILGIKVGFLICDDENGQYASDIGKTILDAKTADLMVFLKNSIPEISLRSNPSVIDSQILASKFGGGGHAPAAGFKLTSPMNEMQLVCMISNGIESVLVNK